VDALTITQENRLHNQVEARGKSIEVNLQEREIAGLKQKYDAEVASLKDEMRFMLELLNSTISR
jgi:hypothetical protein